MSLRVRVAPFSRTGVHLVDLALRALHEALSAVVDAVRREVLVTDVELESGVATQIPHGLGYGYSHVAVSPVRGAVTSGRIEEGTSPDRGKFVVLTATGFGATVTVDLRVT